jgi:hypothetical protein
VVDRPSSAYHPFNDDDTGQVIIESATAVWNLGVNGGADTDEAFILGGPYAGGYVIRTASIVPGDAQSNTWSQSSGGIHKRLS